MYDGGGRVMKRTKLAMVGAMLMTVIAQASLPAATAQTQNSPDSRILIVTENIEEAFGMGRNDPGDMFEIPNFVERLIPRTPFLPDVLLMQEVNYKSSAYLAREMTRQSGQRYVVVARPRQRTTIEYPHQSVHEETGIIINAQTMRVVKKSRYTQTDYPRSAAASGQRPQGRRHAHMMLAEKGTDLQVPVMSLHFARTSDMKSLSVSDSYRAEWARKIESLMQRRYGADADGKVSNVAGDFNMDRCVTGSFASCQEARFWKTFTSRPHRYKDSQYDAGLPIGVDIIFTTGQVFDAGWDEHGKFNESNRKNYYSDHRFRWVVVGR